MQPGVLRRHLSHPTRARTPARQSLIEKHRHFRKMDSDAKVTDQIDVPGLDHHLARMFEIHRDPPANVGLHLPQPPIGPLRMADQHSRFQD